MKTTAIDKAKIIIISNSNTRRPELARKKNDKKLVILYILAFNMKICYIKIVVGIFKIYTF